MRAEQLPELGKTVFDGKKKRVGSVLDIFGPVRSPYLAIRPAQSLTQEDLTSLVGEELYIMGERYGKAGKKKDVSRVRKRKPRARL
jgi:RNA-binding protein